MAVSLNCLILEQAKSSIFNVPIGEDSNINSVNVKFDDLTIANFKDILFNRRELQGITTTNVWKVKLDFHEINNISTEEDIKNHNKSEKIDDNPMLNFTSYYSNVDEDKKPKSGSSYIHSSHRHW